MVFYKINMSFDISTLPPRRLMQAVRFELCTPQTHNYNYASPHLNANENIITKKRAMLTHKLQLVISQTKLCGRISFHFSHDLTTQIIKKPRKSITMKGRLSECDFPLRPVKQKETHEKSIYVEKTFIAIIINYIFPALTV